jgi:hypothetical protein
LFIRFFLTLLLLLNFPNNPWKLSTLPSSTYSYRAANMGSQPPSEPLWTPQSGQSTQQPTTADT